jgi:hypothetical protein
MKPNGRSPWEVVFFETVRQQLRTWAEQAARLGMRDQYAQALRSMVAHLETDPAAWGDPLFHLHHLDLLVYRALATFFYAIYSVDERRRIVYVSQVSAPPGGALDAPGETPPS